MMSALREQVIQVIRERGLSHSDEPMTLASGAVSRDFVDGKRALARGSHLKVAAQALLELVRDAGITFDAVGGLTMGADAYAHAIAIEGDKLWFAVRKETKGRGTNQLIEGAALSPDVRVLLVDDVVTTGGSIVQAFNAIRATGAPVVAAVAVVDRGDYTEPRFSERGVPYLSLMTYTDLGIEPIHLESVNA